jgi:hypothetical protein
MPGVTANLRHLAAHAAEDNDKLPQTPLADLVNIASPPEAVALAFKKTPPEQ